MFEAFINAFSKGKASETEVTRDEKEKIGTKRKKMAYDVRRYPLIPHTMHHERLCPLCKIPFMEIPINE